MYEVIALVGIGAAAALGGFGLGIVYLKTEPYVPMHKRVETPRTEVDVKRTEKQLDKHFSVINIEEDEAFDAMMEEHEPVVEEETIGYGVSEPEPTQNKFFVCDEEGCSYRAKSEAWEDGKHYCKNHVPVGPMKMSD